MGYLLGRRGSDGPEDGPTADGAAELEGEPSIREKWSLVHFMADVLDAAAR